jgi:hypothetical protein
LSRKIKKIWPWFFNYGLAVSCVAAPLVLAFVGFNGALVRLTPDIAKKIEVTYVPADPTAIGAKTKTTSAPATANVTDTEKSRSEQKPADTSDAVTADPKLFLRGLHYRGEAQYAAGSAFIYLASTAVLVFSIVIVCQRLEWQCWVSSFVLFLIIGYVIAYCLPKPRGRELVVESLLTKAELFPTMKLDGVEPRLTGEIASSLVSFNTIAALVPVGMLLMALAALSIRHSPSIPDRADLMLRRNCLRVALALGSTLFVIGVLANKALVDWPLSLVSVPQQVALQPIADAVTLQLGTMGTIAIVAAFTPAMVAWWLDVKIYEEDRARKEAKKKEKQKNKSTQTSTPFQPEAQGATDGSKDDADSSAEKQAAEFAFAPLSAITAIIAALAPLLASPFVDTLKSVAVAFSGK